MSLPFISGTAVGPFAGDPFAVAVDAQLIAQGWVVEDTISWVANNRNRVYKGAAIDATADNRPRVQIVYNAGLSLTALNIMGWADWDVSTHTGIGPAGNASGSTTIAIQDASFNYWMRANGVSFALATKTGASSYNKSYHGFVRRHLSSVKSGVTKAPGAITAGANSVTVASDMTGKIQVGQYIHIASYAHSSASANKLNKELIRVSGVTSTVISFATAVAKNYDAGALLGFNPNPICTTASTTSASQPWGSLYQSAPLDSTNYVSGASNLSNSLSINFVMDQTVTSYGGPELTTQEYDTGYFYIYDANGTANGGFGTPYHWEVTLATAQSSEDTMDDGKYQWQLFNTTTQTAMMGPTNV